MSEISMLALLVAIDVVVIIAIGFHTHARIKALEGAAHSHKRGKRVVDSHVGLHGGDQTTSIGGP